VDAEARDLAAESRDAALLADASDVVREMQLAAAADRAAAAADREQSARDRAAAAAERVSASFDEMTGAYRRAPGLIQVERDIARARRMGESTTIMFVDVDYLKQVNDNRGHAAGDELLRELVAEIKKNLRSYDLVVRYGGDEFICVMSNASTSDAEERLTAVSRSLAERTIPVTVSPGVVELGPTESLADAIARADAAMYQRRRHNRANDA
jgi:diguanylate cyclase (GGDEF)-like protein